MDSETIAILTMPLSNLSSLNRKLNNTRALVLICLQMLIIISYFVLTILSNSLSHDNQSDSSSWNVSAPVIISYLHATVLLLISVFKLYLQFSYYRKLKLCGYQTHYKRTTWHHEVIYKLLNKCSLLLMLLWTVFTMMQHNEKHIQMYLDTSKLLQQHTVCAQGTVCMFALIIFAFLMRQFFLELKFRSDRDLPDVFFIDNSQLPRDSPYTSEMGLRDTSQLEDLLYRQSELIESLKAQNSHLREVLFKVNNARRVSAQ